MSKQLVFKGEEGEQDNSICTQIKKGGKKILFNYGFIDEDDDEDDRTKQIRKTIREERTAAMGRRG